jgi:hypothetical protein
MKTLAHSFSLYVIGLATAFLVLGGASVRAQQSQQLPFPQSQLPPPAYHRPRATPSPAPSSAGVVTIPQIQQAQPQPTMPSAPVYHPAPQITPAPPPLPAIFRGCWQGRVDFIDTIQRLPGGARVGPWTPKTYRLCYRRTGNGPFELTFTEAGIARSNKITNATGKMDVVSTDGRTYAAMRSLLHFDEYRLPSDPSGGRTFPVDELTQLQCNIEPDGMHVTGNVYGERNGTPWFRASWHAIFVHTADEQPLPE